MRVTPSIATANAMLNGTGLKEQLDGGFLYVFAGPVPATADEALDLVSKHTALVKISLNSTATGLTLSAPASGAIGKPSGDTWAGAVNIDGYQGSETELAPTFCRFCVGLDDGRGAADGTTGYRIQGTAGGPNSGAFLQFGVAELVDGNTQPVGAFSLSLQR